MKTLPKILLGALLVSGLHFGLTGCVSDGYVSESVYYGHRDPWFRDDPWMDGRYRYYDRGPGYRGGGSVDVYISPPRLPSPPRIHLP